MKLHNYFALTLGCLSLASLPLSADSLRADAALSDHSEILRDALSALPAQRNIMATLTLEGVFKISGTIVLENYTRLDLSQARIRQIGEKGFTLFKNADDEGGNFHIELVGGEIVGNRLAAENAGDCIGFVRVGNLRLENLEISDCGRDGIFLSGGGRHTRHVVIRDVRVNHNRRYGLVLSWAMRNVVVDSVSASNNGVDGVYSDHSESNYRNITATENGRDGIFIRNVFNNSYTDLLAFRNERHGIRVLGMCYSQGRNWNSYINGQRGRDGNDADIYFEALDNLSYGITSNARVDGINAGSNLHMLKLKTPYALYIEKALPAANSYQSLVLNDVRLEGKSQVPTSPGIELNFSVNAETH
jgi:hypothetical protein